MKSYLLLYGIGRNKKNIKKLIYFFKHLSPDIKIIYNYFRVNSVNNIRSGELGLISYRDIEKTTPNTFEYKIDNNIKDKLLTFSKKFNDGHKDNFKSNSNLINQLMLLNNLSSKIKDINDDDLVVVFRDDVKFDFLSKFILTKIWNKLKKSKNINISAFSWHGGYNDKFFISNAFNAKILLSRIIYIKESIENYGHLNAEELIYYVTKKNGIKVKPIFCRVARLRINGKVKWDPYFPSIQRPNDLIRVIKSLCNDY